MGHLTWLEAIVIGGLQGVAELFPVSSLGHSILIPALVGGTWAQDLDVSAPESPYLAFVVGLHVATALALVVYFWRDWVRIIRGLATSIVRREVVDADQRLAWLLVLATIPVGVSGLLLEHVFRVYLSKPLPTAAFLTLNGVLLLVGERLRRRADARDEALGQSRPAPAAAEAASAEAAAGPTAAFEATGTGATAGTAGTAATGTAATEKALAGSSAMGTAAGTAAMAATGAGTAAAGPAAAGMGTAETGTAVAADRRLAALSVRTAMLIGAAQIAALAPGISRSGSAMVAGLTKGLSHTDAARFSFLLATPVILAAGLLKLGDLAGPLGDGIRPQILVGSLLSGLGAYISVRFLTRWFETRSLRPFGIYCLVAGLGCLVWFSSELLAWGDRVGLLGAKGAGKTTLLRVLAGIYRPTLGSIELIQSTCNRAILLEEGRMPRPRPDRGDSCPKYLAGPAGRRRNARSGLPKPLIPYIAPPSLGPRGGVVTRRSAKPFTRVRFPTWPPSQPLIFHHKVRFGAGSADRTDASLPGRAHRVCPGLGGHQRFRPDGIDFASAK